MTRTASLPGCLTPCRRAAFLALSHPASDLGGSGHPEMRRPLNPLMAAPVTLRTKARVIRFFDGVELLEPGVVVAAEWRPGCEFEARAPAAVRGGVGRKG